MSHHVKAQIRQVLRYNYILMLNRHPVMLATARQFDTNAAAALQIY